MKRTSSRGNTYIVVIVVVVVALVVAAVVFLLLNRNHSAAKSAKQSANLSSYCVGQTFARGDSGHCVQDVQALASYIYAHLNELPTCNEPVASVAYDIKTTGTYDYTDEGVVQLVQSWAQCYAKQEGFTTNVKATGAVDKPTWGELCTYGYTDPLHTQATGASASIAAGKDAGCPKLQS